MTDPMSSAEDFFDKAAIDVIAGDGAFTYHAALQLLESRDGGQRVPRADVLPIGDGVCLVPSKAIGLAATGATLCRYVDGR